MNYNIRQEYIDILKGEVVGPEPSHIELLNQSNGEEILRGIKPLIRYGAGVLFPKSSDSDSIEEINNLSDGIELESEGNSPNQNELMIDEPVPEDFEESSMKKTTNSDYEDNDNNDDIIRMVNAHKPSAMGVSCIVLTETKELKVVISTAIYKKGIFNCRFCDNSGQSKTGKGYKCTYCNKSKNSNYNVEAYYRIPLQFERKIKFGNLIKDKKIRGTLLIKDSIIPIEKSLMPLDNNDGLVISFELMGSKRLNDSEHMLRVSLINNNQASINLESRPRYQNRHCFFQTKFEIEMSDKNQGFRPIQISNALQSEIDVKVNQLLYRDKPVFAVGNGCSVNWDQNSNKAFKIWTESIPTFEMFKIDAEQKKRFKDINLSFLQLSDAGKIENVIPHLNKIKKTYSSWLLKMEKKSIDLEKTHQATAKRNIEKCRKALSRIEEGILLIENNKTVMTAFRLMNRAILLQHLKSKQKLLEWEMNGDDYQLNELYTNIEVNDNSTWPDLSYNPSWYPYQLAFILINIKSIVEPTSTDRDNVECLWFPTGGGKTEAYLGLIGFSIMYRRLKNPDSVGVIAVMRYTLRLLTAQQFQRAGSLIAACDFIRYGMSDVLGNEQISIGLWVGPMSPNRTIDARNNYNEMRTDPTTTNLLIINKCPWCSASMGQNSMINESGRSVSRLIGYKEIADGRTSKVRFVCENKNCHFSKTDRYLPIYVVDEDLYTIKPSLVIGTVDKFARLAWDNSSCDSINLFRHIENVQDPPDLIIQDELHLISGPLGSVVGMYETTIQNIFAKRLNDQIIYPKVIASTATVTRASEQMNQLYNNHYESSHYINEMVNLFPHPVIDYNDSFFGKELDDPESSRIYVGLNPTAYSDVKTAQTRIISSLLQGAKNIAVSTESERNPYWTLMMYFNSIRELSGVSTLINDDVQTYFPQLKNRKYPDVLEELNKLDEDEKKNGWEKACFRSTYFNDLELTSRQTNDISFALKKLEANYPKETIRPVDICLATNMISVGVDISRLGSMLVVGQPKTTSEYIQATSRIGRQYPGVVFVWYNNSRPRDKSHYEQFLSYHQQVYSMVEPTSITPFSDQVRERALHAQIFTLAKYFGSRNAVDIPNDELKEKIKDIILKKVKAIDANELISTEKNIDQIFSRWNDYIKLTDWGNMGGRIPGIEEYHLMFPFGKESPEHMKSNTFKTLTSMRNVDSECKGMIIQNYQEL